MSYTRFLSSLFPMSSLLFNAAHPNVNREMDLKIQSEKKIQLKKFNFYKNKLQQLREFLLADHEKLNELLESHLIPSGVQMQMSLDPTRSLDHQMCIQAMHEVIKKGRTLARDMNDHLRLLVAPFLSPTSSLDEISKAAIQLKFHVGISKGRVDALHQRYRSYRQQEFFKQVMAETGDFNHMVDTIVELVKTKTEPQIANQHFTRSRGNC